MLLPVILSDEKIPGLSTVEPVPAAVTDGTGTDARGSETAVAPITGAGDRWTRPLPTAPPTTYSPPDDVVRLALGPTETAVSDDEFTRTLPPLTLRLPLPDMSSAELALELI